MRERLQQIGHALAAAAPAAVDDGVEAVASPSPAPRVPTTLDLPEVDGDGDASMSSMFEHATEDELRAALSPLLLASQPEEPALASAFGSLVGAAPDAAPRPAEQVALPEIGDPVERRKKLRATAQNLLRLHRLSLSPYGDGVSGEAVLREAPPRG